MGLHREKVYRNLFTLCESAITSLVSWRQMASTVLPAVTSRTISDAVTTVLQAMSSTVTS